MADEGHPPAFAAQAHPVGAAAPQNTVSMLQGAHNFTIRDHAHITNIGVNNVTNYAGTIDLDIMKKFMEEFISFNALHDSSVQDPDRQCHPETRRGVLKQVQDWIDDPNAEPILWLHGPAGIGKSAIAQTIARSGSRDKVSATFFFYRSDPSRNDGNRLFTTLAWQLAFLIPGLKPHIINSLHERPDIPRKDVETQFEELIIRPFQAIATPSAQATLPAPVIIIDGLDECVNEKLQRRILNLIGSAVTDGLLPLRFLICSRSEAHIQATINTFQCPAFPLDLSKLDDANKDIERYLEAEFCRIASEQDLDLTWPGEEIIQKFVYKASGHFIYVSTLIKFIDDEHSCATAQLDIVLGLKPPEDQKPFVELDALYMEILKRQTNQNFLRDIFSLIIGHGLPVCVTLQTDQVKNYAILANLSEKELHRKLRGMRSLIQLDYDSVDVYHKSFLDFLQDASRAGQYHISDHAAERRFLEMIINSIVRYVAEVFERPDCHERHFSLEIYLEDATLSLEEVHEARQLLVNVQDKLLSMKDSTLQRLQQCSECTILSVIRNFLLYFTYHEELLEHKAASLVQGAKKNIIEDPGTFHPLAPSVAMEEQFVLENLDLDSILSLVLDCLRERKSSESPPSPMIVELMYSILSFDYVAIAMSVRSIADGQLLIDVLDYIISAKDFQSQRRASKTRSAARLALEIHARVPVLPRSCFFSCDHPQHFSLYGYPIMEMFTPIFLGRILDSYYVLKASFEFKEGTLYPVHDAMDHYEPIKEWQGSVSVTRIMFEIAKAIQYIDSMDILLHSSFGLHHILAKSECHIKIFPLGEMLPFTGLSSMEVHSKNVYTLGCIFYELYFDLDRSDFEYMTQGPSRSSGREISDELWQLIQRCYAADTMNQITIDEVVLEMESWKID